MDNSTNDPKTIRLQNEKTQAEIDKLRAEERKIEAERKEIAFPFWRRMQWYASFGTIAVALTAALYGYFGKYFEAVGHEQEAKQKNLEYDTKVLQDKKDVLSIKFYRDSVRLIRLQEEEGRLRDTIHTNKSLSEVLQRNIEVLKQQLVSQQKKNTIIKDSMANNIVQWKKHAEFVEDRVALTRDYYMDSCSFYVHNYKVLEKLYNELLKKCQDKQQ